LPLWKSRYPTLKQSSRTAGALGIEHPLFRRTRIRCRRLTVYVQVQKWNQNEKYNFKFCLLCDLNNLCCERLNERAKNGLSNIHP
jgi:hypothetical protein